MISSSAAAAVLIAVAMATGPVLVSSMPEHAKRYRNNGNDISQHHVLSRSGDIVEDPTSQEVVIYEETYPYPAEYQPTDYYPQHYNYQYHQRPGTQVDRQDAQDRVFLGGLGILPMVMTGFALLAGTGMAIVGSQLSSLQESFEEEVNIVREEVAGTTALLGPLLEGVLEDRLEGEGAVGVREMIKRVREQSGVLDAVQPAVSLLETDIVNFARVAVHLCTTITEAYGGQCPIPNVNSLSSAAYGNKYKFKKKK